MVPPPNFLHQCFFLMLSPTINKSTVPDDPSESVPHLQSEFQGALSIHTVIFFSVFPPVFHLFLYHNQGVTYGLQAYHRTNLQFGSILRVRSTNDSMLDGIPIFRFRIRISALSFRTPTLFRFVALFSPFRVGHIVYLTLVLFTHLI